MQNELEVLKIKVATLEKELLDLKKPFEVLLGENTVIVPVEAQPLFDIAQKTVKNYFQNLKMEPHKGTIEINDQRYVLIRASALSVDFLNTIQNLYADRGPAEALSIGKNLLFDLAHTLGVNDAHNFHDKMNLTVPMAKLSAGPVHFAYTGWAFVEILEESNPSPDENFYLLYNHPFSFEADSWKRSGKIAETPVCIMSAGYSSGWCEESFGIPLTAVEVSCLAKGDDKCTFIMSPPDKIQDHLSRYNPNKKDNIKKQVVYDVPTYFERKKVEEEMQRSKALAESAVKAKENFISNMSHELRTPLGAVLGFTELLGKTKLSDLQQEYLAAISSSGNSLLKLINDILDLSKLDAEKLQVENEPISLPEFLHSIEIMFAGQAKKKNLDFIVETDDQIKFLVWGDIMRLTQILINLTGNAIKFTEEGSVAIMCTLENQTAESATIQFLIKDSGIGIEEKYQEAIFERFVQADNNITRNYGGTGLGLSITKELVGLLGGTLLLNSGKGKGAEFLFTLKMEKSDMRHLPVSTDTEFIENVEEGKVILVVEDNYLNQKLTTTILENNHFKFKLAGNGQEAVDMLKLEPVDLILMDIQMPLLDGYKATCIIRDKMDLHMPIIAMTAHAMAGEKDKCRQNGINDYLPKPFTEKDLLKKINYWLKNSSGKIPGRITDLSFLRKQTRNNELVIKEMVTTFIKQIPIDLENIKKAIASKNFKEIYELLHAFRNSIGLFGFSKLMMDVIIEMENNARSGAGLENIEEDFIIIEKSCNTAVKEMQLELN